MNASEKLRVLTKRYPMLKRIFLHFLLILAILLVCVSCRPITPPSVESGNEELVLLTQRDQRLKVLQFTDMHFGEEGTTYHNADVKRTLAFIDYAIKTEQPDLIVLLGDNMMSQGVKGAKFLVETFDQYKIPYTLIYGNHDAETYQLNHKKSDVSRYLENCDSPYLLYKSGFVQEGKENRYGNFSISLRDEESRELIGAFVLLDTGTYDYEADRYQMITQEQIAWYEAEIARLNAIYGEQSQNALGTVPTITYGHMPLPKFGEAYQKASNNDGAEFIYYQKLSGWVLGGANSSPEGVEDSFFDAMKKMQSARAYICGHYHMVTCHVKMDGIILGFCPQTGFTHNSTRPCSTFSYTIGADFEMDLHLVVEPQSAD